MRKHNQLNHATIDLNKEEQIYQCLTQLMDLSYSLLFSEIDENNQKFRQITSLMFDTGMNNRSMSIQMTYSHYYENIKKNSYSVVYSLSNVEHFIDTYEAKNIEQSFKNLFHFINEIEHVEILRKCLPEDLCLSADTEMFNRSKKQVINEKRLTYHEKYMLEKELNHEDNLSLINKNDKKTLKL